VFGDRAARRGGGGGNRARQHVWLSASGRVRADIALHPRFGIGIEAGALAPIVRPRFVFDAPRRTAAEAGALGAEIGAFLWLSFP